MGCLTMGLRGDRSPGVGKAGAASSLLRAEPLGHVCPATPALVPVPPGSLGKARTQVTAWLGGSSEKTRVGVNDPSTKDPSSCEAPGGKGCDGIFRKEGSRGCEPVGPAPSE